MSAHLLKKRPGRKLKPAHRLRLVLAAAPLMWRAHPTPFALEATIRHWLRGRLCLQGWAWRDADLAAEDVVESALARIRAQRPTWKQGQPEWTQEGVIMVERHYCINCDSLLPEGHKKFCSANCSSSYNNRRYRMDKRNEAAAIEELGNAA